MNRNRYLLCLLLSGWMIYYALPRLHLFNTGAEGIFAKSWAFFAMMVIAGNLSAIIYTPKNRKKDAGSAQRRQSKKRVRSFHG